MNVRSNRSSFSASGGARAASSRSVCVAWSVTAAAWLLMAAPCMALECPTPQSAGAPGAIQETPTQFSELSQVLASGDLGNRLPGFVHALRIRHPNVPTGELVNDLVTAYCPGVNGVAGLSDGEKHAKMSAFVSQVVQAAY
jgi:hypothetical protein